MSSLNYDWMKEEYAKVLGVFSKYDSTLIEFYKKLESMVDDAVKDSLPHPISKVELVLVTVFEWLDCILEMVREGDLQPVLGRNIRFWDMLED